MASNSFGNLFRITTWGESHGKGIGVVIDGCPAGLPLSEEEINIELRRRAPAGNNPYTTPRKEADFGEIYSGVFEGKTTGAPIAIIIMNNNADSSKYEPIKNLLRPGHANYTYLEKYGCFDYRGGGRASARETACRVAAGAVAKKLLAHYNVEIAAFIRSIGTVNAEEVFSDIKALKQQRDNSPVYCPSPVAAGKMMQAISAAKEAGDSLGGVVEFAAHGLPIGLGDPVYEKIEANLAKAMMSLPATKGFTIGEGFSASTMLGSAHNDTFHAEDEQIKLTTNKAGGTLGGITTGEVLRGHVAFKPTSSIKKQQQSVNLQAENKTFKLPEGSRHDPCVAIRAVPVVEAMVALTLVDALLLNRCVKL
ncbi:MAG: chorismate synthase [Pseudomonadota bacterium]